jgi:hypothetical protein
MVNHVGGAELMSMNRFAAVAVIGMLALLAGIRTAEAQLFDPSNWSFESGLTNWTAYDPVDRIMPSTTFARTGTNSLLFATTNNPSRVQYDVASEGGVDVGISYTGSVWYYISSALVSNEAIGAQITFYDVVGTTWTPLGATAWDIDWGPDDFGPDTTTVGAWTPLQVVATAPAGADAIQFGMQVFGRGSNVYFDDVSVVPEPATGVLILGAAGALAFLKRRLSKRSR